jgi:hypothetical protein
MQQVEEMIIKGGGEKLLHTSNTVFFRSSGYHTRSRAGTKLRSGPLLVMNPPSVFSYFAGYVMRLRSERL